MNAIKQSLAILAYRASSGLCCEVVLRVGFTNATNSKAYQTLDRLSQRARRYADGKRA